MADKSSDNRPAIFWINEAVIDDYNLNPYEGWLYVVILKHANRTTGEAFPGIATLSKLTGMSKRKVSSCIVELEKKNLIRVERDMKPVKGETRQREVNHYFILAVEGNAQGALGVQNGVHQGSASSALGVMHKVHNNSSSSFKSKKKTEREILLEQLTPYLEIANCILVLIESGYDENMYKPNEYMPNALIKKYLPHLEELARLQATPSELKGLYGHFKPEYDMKGWAFGVQTFVTKLQPYRASKALTSKTTAAAARPAPAPEPEVTEAQRAELLEAVRMIRPDWEALKAS